MWIDAIPEYSELETVAVTSRISKITGEIPPFGSKSRVKEIITGELKFNGFQRPLISGCINA
jgi:hypothetical protein